MAVDFKKTTIVFCDGACSGNPGRGGWGAVIATPEGVVRELGGGDLQTTNNKMELTGAIEALSAILKGEPETPEGPVWIYTDSTYVIRGITQWIWGWMKNGWKSSEGKDVSNQEEWQRLSRLVGQVKKRNPITWKYVKGHSGVPGNERCDEIAVAFSTGKSANLFYGSLLKYDVAVMDLPPDVPLPEIKQVQGEKKAAFSYLSLIGSIPMRHASWPECERRVKGQSGAKFKKAMSEAEEAEILRSWGLDPAKVKL
ncbi:MAG TPA: RNase H family protein [Bdellovibrionales bacterium]|nr:RNase H family protein [Bdellovibrionales bacterium]